MGHSEFNYINTLAKPKEKKKKKKMAIVELVEVRVMVNLLRVEGGLGFEFNFHSGLLYNVALLPYNLEFSFYLVYRVQNVIVLPLTFELSFDLFHTF